MKIIYLSPHPQISVHDISGPGVHIREIMHGFRERGHEVIWASPNNKQPGVAQPQLSSGKNTLKKIIKAITPKIIWETMRDIQLIWIDRRFEKELAAMIELHKPDFIYERVYYMMGCGYRAAKAAKVKYLIEVNSPYTLEKPSMSHKSLLATLAERNEKNQLEAVDQAFVVASSLKTYFIEKYPSIKDKITVTPNAVRKEHTLPASEDDKIQARKELSLNNGDILITFVGSIFPYHGVDILIQAYHDVKRQTNKRVKLLIVGDGEILEDLKTLAKNLGLSDDVTFTGKTASEKIRLFLSVTDIAVQANCNWYNSPIKLFEYGSKRLAIIAPRYPGVEDVMQGDAHGLIIEPNQGSLSKAIMLLVDDPELRNRLAEAFHQQVVNNYTWDAIAERILKFV